MKTKKKWLKLWTVIDINTKFILAYNTWYWSSNDISCGDDLFYKSNHYNISIRLKDAWFDWWFNLKDWQSIVPPIKRWWTLKNKNRINRNNEYLLLKDIGLFWQRWQVESSYSVIKRKFSDNIRELSFNNQSAMAWFFVLAYNVRL